ncbi:hypothetical protein MMC24_006148 [Lignoscripta atroalba]|nr:hypothetical protein [Lignoscripta atroalba]
MNYSYLDPIRQQFRLLSLHSRESSSISSEDAPIKCELYVASRIDKPYYKALSYTWDGDLVPIKVNGAEVLVTSNLRTALEYIRDRDVDETLWIDAICINQGDNTENGDQVAHMREIYENAETTIVWLGPAGDDSDLVIAEFTRIGEHLSKHGITNRFIQMAHLASGETELFQSMERSIQEDLSDLFEKWLNDFARAVSIRTACAKLLSRKYWHRVWILQEFVMSSKIRILSGKASIPFLYFHGCLMFMPLATGYLEPRIRKRLMQQIETSVNEVDQSLYAHFVTFINTTIDENAHAIVGMRSNHQNNQIGSRQGIESLMRLLLRVHGTGSAEATLGRDRIFALLGMASDAEALGIVPDYDMSQPDSVIFAQATRAMITSGHIDLLCFSQGSATTGDPPETAKDRVPSWVPDWRVKMLRPYGQLPWDTPFSAFGRLGFRNTSSLKILTSVQLNISGCRVDVLEDVIQSVATIMETAKPGWKPSGRELPKGDSLLWGEYLSKTKDLCARSNAKHIEVGVDIYSNASDREAAHIRFPIADQEEYSDIAFIRRATEASNLGYHQLIDDIICHAQMKAPGSSTEEKRSYYNRLMAQTSRRPFLSSKGFVGLAPDHAEKGDIIVIFSGGKFPYLLRENGNNGTYTFIGEAFVHGIMYGEFMHDARDVEEFLLE